MSTMASKITTFTIVYSTVYSSADQSKKTWGRQNPDGPHVGHMNLAIWDIVAFNLTSMIWTYDCVKKKKHVHYWPLFVTEIYRWIILTKGQ